MHWLAKIGFSQSYTYFTWRYTKEEIISYVSELVKMEVTDYFRPNFWPNTPDILPLDLQYYGEPAFKTKFILAATLSSNYGVYGPAFEQMINTAVEETEEYLHAEKYEIRYWDASSASPIISLMTLVNTIRRQNPALQRTDNIQFLKNDNLQIISFIKSGPHMLVIVVNLDPYNVQSTQITIPCVGVTSYRVHELLEDKKFIWQDSTIEVTIDPKTMPARIFKIQTSLIRESAFDYFM
jgi:starch synthase (maltosyl-transferring)